MTTSYDTAPRLALISASLATAEMGIVRRTGSSISFRHHEGMLVTPAVIPPTGMTPDDIAYVHDDGVADGRLLPADDWPFHLDLFHRLPKIEVVARLQLPSATALACLRRPLPRFHYLVDEVIGGEMACTDLAPAGSTDLARLAALALKGRRACLLANNGLVVVADAPADAIETAAEIDALCDQYLRALAVGEPVVLDDGVDLRSPERSFTLG